MPDYVFPTSVCVVRYEGGRVHLNPSQQWRTDDPFVKARPELFAAEPRTLSRTTEPVEQATKAPGEKRATRGPTRKPE